MPEVTLPVNRLFRGARTFNFAHALTGARLILTPVFLVAVEAAMQRPTLGRIGWVVGLFAAICASDYCDGPLARALDRSSDWGRLLDNAADVTFLLVTLGYLTSRGVVPWWIPAAVGGAFAQYAIDSWWLSRHAPRITLVSNPIGHWAGVLNYAGVGVMALHAATQARLFAAPLVQALLLAWIGYLLLAVGVRLRFFLGARAAVRRDGAAG